MGEQEDRMEQPKVGRNDPCPCGSGEKYKKCCGSDPNEPGSMAYMRQEVIRWRTLSHLFLSQILKLTGSRFLGVPLRVLGQYDPNATVYLRRDPRTGDFHFYIDDPDGAGIITPDNKIISPAFSKEPEQMN